MAAAALAFGGLVGFAQATPTTSANNASSVGSANPYDPSYQHPYRHGAVPTIQQQLKMKSWAQTHVTPNATTATGPETLSYGGGIDGIGVMSGGKPKVYLVFYGNQWGTQSTDGNGNLTFSGDPDAGAPYAQQMFKGIGTGGELWSGTMTQYCDGSGVSSGATSCPSSGVSHVQYASGGALAGVWYDNSGAEPSAATGHQLGQEAVNAAAHFGNTTAAANRDSYYVILSPTGTNPDNYQGQYCAWHDYNGDSTLTGGAVTSPYGDIAFSNQPYNMDSGSGCGVGFVNSPGTLDGYSITMGHEFAETVTDQNPAGGWTNQQSGSSYNGQENGDECAWLTPGSAGGAGNVSMGNGSYAMQATWSNDDNSCDISHAIVGGSSPVSVNNPGSQTGTVGTAASLQLSATGGTAPYTWTATGLPTGLSISSAGLVSGTPSAAGTFSVTATAKDSTGATASATFSWTISNQTGPVTVTNPGSQTGTVGTAASLQLKASGGTSPYTWTASGLPAGLSVSSAGLISGTPTTAGTSTVTVTAKDSTGATGSASFSWTINPSGGGCTSPGQKLANPGFESGSTGWSATPAVIGQNGPSEPAHTGSWDAWLDGYGVPHTDTLSQSVTIPSGCKATLSFWLHIDSDEAGTPNGTLTVKVGSTTVATFSDNNANTGYTQYSYNVSQFAGQKVTLLFTGVENDYAQTSYVIDDTALTAS